ncbi:MAG: capsule assembly Wzi family protein, partial [Gemmatimonadota bacterium]|nr:capsule assembly Wzi family protein [Gemmatimonadota bacterium]
MVRAWYARFLEEFSEIVSDPTGPRAVRMLGSSAAMGYRSHSGSVSPATGVNDLTIGPAPVPDEAALFVSAATGVSISSFAGLLVEPEIGARGPGLRAWDLAIQKDPFALSIGRQAGGDGYGDARGGGLLLSGAVPMNRVVLRARPLGRLSLHTLVSRFAEQRHPGDALFWAAGVTLRLHSRMDLSLHRGVMFGGDSVEARVTPRYLFRTLVGYNSAENQIASAGFRYRIPMERVLPVTAYGEWGADDIAGASTETPGLLLGAFVPGLPSLPQVSIGAEWSFFAGQCCGHGFWYRHNVFTGNWVARN